MSSFTNIRVKVPENEINVVTANSLEGTASTITRVPITHGPTSYSRSSASPTRGSTSINSRTTSSVSATGWINTSPNKETASTESSDTSNSGKESDRATEKSAKLMIMHGTSKVWEGEGIL
ncbi:unnamed protein product [Strongylus vulgaris]|uniref:Uncharacterized protein n=1 Tax=Strongylus vulgaris TaxID=40348 RepID=A0A3P7JBU1_STRVU|nr:unnamed protein product [Strongylus vulgaris]